MKQRLIQNIRASLRNYRYAPDFEKELEKLSVKALQQLNWTLMDADQKVRRAKQAPWRTS